jgi:hypothetical protein
MTNSFADNFEDDFGTDASSAPAVRKPVNPASSAHPTAPSMNNAFTTSYAEKCKACSGSGKFVSWSGRVVGECFKCKGKGEMFFKTNSADRARARDLAAARKGADAEKVLAKFADQHPIEAAWIEASRATFAFAQSMHDAIRQWGHLTERQLAACTNAAAKAAARQADRAVAATARLEAAPVVSMDKLMAAFAAASAAGLKSPKLRVNGLVISPAKAASANAGFLYVKNGETYLGKVSPEGKFLRGRDCDDAAEAHLLTVAADPLAAAVSYGKATGSCSCCGKELTNKISIDLGIGPICRAKWGLG